MESASLKCFRLEFRLSQIPLYPHLCRLLRSPVDERISNSVVKVKNGCCCRLPVDAFSEDLCESETSDQVVKFPVNS